MPRPDHLRLSLIVQLRCQIENCQAPGEALPSQRDLALAYGGTPSTIRRALNVLRQEGLVLPRPRVGWIRAPLTGEANQPVEETCTDGVSPARMENRSPLSMPCHEAREGTLLAEGRPLRVGLLSRRRRSDWEKHQLLRELLNEAARRGVELIEVPNPRQFYPTRGGMRLDLSQVPWNNFDVGMLVEIEDPLMLGSPLLFGKRILAVDQDSTGFGLHSVSFANWEAGAVAARHLYGLGHRRFAVANEVNREDRVCDPSWTARRLGFESTLGSLGGIIRPEWRIALSRYGRSNPAFDFRKTIRNWSSYAPQDRPTALFAPSLFQVAEIIQCVREAGMRVPEDLSTVVVTWNRQDRFIESLEHTIVYLNFERMIRRSFEAAEEVAQRPPHQPGGRPLHVVLPVKLIEGKSTRSCLIKPNEYA